jgi:hypothetical protein
MQKIKNFITKCCKPSNNNNFYKHHVFTDCPNKFAISIGINYANDSDNNNNLNGCINDLNDINQFLLEKCNFSSSNIYSLSDEEATKNNIESAINDMVQFSHQYDNTELWFSFSGHGVQKNSFVEKDGKTELICPVDYHSNGYISDNWLKHNFINKLSKTSKLFVLMDCCHSGSNFDLPYKLQNKNIIQVEPPSQDIANVIKISGCRDDQTSTDFYDLSEQEHQGALTCAFLDSNSSNKFTKRHHKIINSLKSNGFKQKPILSFTKPDLINWYLYDETYELQI